MKKERWGEHALIGDVTGKVMLAHVASAQGLAAAANAAGRNFRMEYSIVPGCGDTCHGDRCNDIQNCELIMMSTHLSP